MSHVPDDSDNIMQTEKSSHRPKSSNTTDSEESNHHDLTAVRRSFAGITDYRQFKQVRNRTRTPTPPFDDYPVPDIDDMTIDKRFMTYTRKRSRVETQQTPVEYEEERREWIRRRNARREREDQEMFEGLRAFKRERQRGWNGRLESERRAQEEMRRVNQQLPKSPDLPTLAPYPPTTTKEVETGFESLESQYTMDVLGAEDHVSMLQDRNHNDMMKAKWDLDVIRESSLAERDADNERQAFSGKYCQSLAAAESSERMTMKDRVKTSLQGVGKVMKIRLHARRSKSPSKKRNMLKLTRNEGSLEHLIDTTNTESPVPNASPSAAQSHKERSV